jgi:hypothetical protein
MYIPIDYTACLACRRVIRFGRICYASLKCVSKSHYLSIITSSLEQSIIQRRPAHVLEEKTMDVLSVTLCVYQQSFRSVLLLKRLQYSTTLLGNLACDHAESDSTKEA